MAGVRLVDDVVVHQTGGMQQLNADSHVVQRLSISTPHAPDEQRQRRPQAFPRTRQHRRQHGSEHPVIALGQRRERSLQMRQAWLHQSQNGANGVGVR